MFTVRVRRLPITLERGMELGPGMLGKVRSSPPADAQHPNVMCKTGDFAPLQHDGGSIQRTMITRTGYRRQEKLGSTPGG